MIFREEFGMHALKSLVRRATYLFSLSFLASHRFFPLRNHVAAGYVPLLRAV